MTFASRMHKHRRSNAQTSVVASGALCIHLCSIHTFVCTSAYINTYVCTHTYICVHIICMHTFVISTCIHTYDCTSTCINAYVSMHMYQCICIYTHVYYRYTYAGIHTHEYQHIFMYTHIDILIVIFVNICMHEL